MRIPAHQMKAFSEEAMRDFEDRMIAHLGVMFPAYVKHLGAAEIRGLVQLGVRRAATHGIIAERGVCIYVDMMFAFGRDFEDDPRCAWARAILRDPVMFADPEGRAQKLFLAGMDHLEEAEGLWGRKGPPPAKEGEVAP